jgi:hypothetical protein
VLPSKPPNVAPTAIAAHSCVSDSRPLKGSHDLLRSSHARLHLQTKLGKRRCETPQQLVFRAKDVGELANMQRVSGVERVSGMKRKSWSN